jgi:diguanylate cyclase (GGDEF)-like protein
VVLKETRIYKTFLLSICLTTLLCLLAIFLWTSARTSNLIHEQFLFRARAQFDGIVLAREWNSHYGGVYVEKKNGLHSNPHLKNPDITTRDGRVFTNIIPAQMTREISEISQQQGKLIFHITSLDPINPINRADDFERDALQQFAAGTKEVFTIEERGHRSYYRYMAPLLVSKDCLNCHLHQGYRLGDVRGGISVSFDIEDLHRKLQKNNMLILFLGASATLVLLSAICYFTINLIRKLVAARKKIEFLAITDGLTRLLNRRHVMERFEEEFERCQRFDEQLSCIMFDLDHFKRVNDEHGHQSGDEVLRSVAAMVQENVRAYDIAGRFGGEEFIIVLPQADLESCLMFAERLRSQVEKAPIPVNDGTTTLKVTISLGVAALRGEDSSVNDLIRRADEALYRAKKNGRNRVEPLKPKAAPPS